MSPLLVVIVTFGLIFVVTATLGQGLSISGQTMAPLGKHSQLNVMLLISTFIVLPALFIGLAAIVHFDNQVKMAIIVLAVCGGAPFVPWLVSLAKGNLAYSVAATSMLLIATFVVLPLAVPPLQHLLDTGAKGVTVWHVAWPLLLFMVLPLLIGILIRARYLGLAMAIGPWLGPISITFLVVHIALFIGYSWSEFLSIAGYGQMAFTLAFPLAGMLIGYLLSPPYVLSPVPPADSHRGSKIVSSVVVAQQNTGAVICCAIFAFGNYTVAGDYLLLGAIVTIIIVLAVMAELGARFDKTQALAPSAPQVSVAGGAVPTPENPVGEPAAAAPAPAPAVTAPETGAASSSKTGAAS